ncbi:hypothetical protein EST38_g2822 [Candolleomyces aberdarensis]|uniref:Uncharacterized protein n=1 Tax=Candolleomyces aberdarensis TaxID=2316362 RepID=A0A4Q2DVT4_9AGAR|nr:hypothetical protein EST38_g2822 [Candolleomyces aberdarensis]
MRVMTGARIFGGWRDKKRPAINGRVNPERVNLSFVSQIPSLQAKKHKPFANAPS